MKLLLDAEILKFARAQAMVILSADSDFTTMLALSGAARPSLVLFRSTDRLAPDEQYNLLQANLGTVQADLESGAIVSISPQHLRVRSLPIVKNP